jgi:hypothetical protein
VEQGCRGMWLRPREKLSTPNLKMRSKTSLYQQN